MGEQSELSRRDWATLKALVDPIATAVLAATEPWDAYDAACTYGQILEDPDLPHAGAVYVAWAELTDVFETGMTREEIADSLLRDRAVAWLAQPTEPSSEWILEWVARTRDGVTDRFDADGNWWRPPAQ